MKIRSFPFLLGVLFPSSLGAQVPEASDFGQYRPQGELRNATDPSSSETTRIFDPSAEPLSSLRKYAHREQTHAQAFLRLIRENQSFDHWSPERSSWIPEDGEIRSGLIEADTVVIPEGVTVFAKDLLLVKAARCEIHGAIVGIDGDRDSNQDGVSVAIITSEDLFVYGTIRGGHGYSASTDHVDFGLDISGLPIVLGSGGSGGNGGSVLLKCGPDHALRLSESGIIAAGDGGQGNPSLAEGWTEGFGQESFSAQAWGGAGGVGGSVFLLGGFSDVLGSVRLGRGGDGGDASAFGGDGAEAALHGSRYYLPTSGGYAAAIAGEGGESGDLRVDCRHDFSSFEVEGGEGGYGGSAHAEAGQSAPSDPNRDKLGALEFIKPVCPDASWATVSRRSFSIGASFSIGGRGGHGHPGGRGGSAYSGNGANGTDSVDGPGSNGQNSEAFGGDGGTGKCTVTKAHAGGPGEKAQSLNGGDGGRGGADLVVDANPGGRGGYSLAEGGDGGDGADCTFGKGDGGRGGNASSGKGGDGGKGGICSDGGDGADSIAIGGDGGIGKPGGDGGGALTSVAGFGGTGSACTCTVRGQGGDGGRGGDSLATGGDGGGRYKSRHDCGDGGDARSSDAGDGGRASSGTPGGLGGDGGRSVANGGQLGCDGASTGKGTSGFGGDGGLSGAFDPCVGGGPGPTWSVVSATVYNRSRPGGGWIGEGVDASFYIFGGELFASQWGFTRTPIVERWDLLTQSWSIDSATMPNPVSNISGSCEVNNGVIYVFGGYDGTNNAIANIQAFDGQNFIDTGASMSEAAWGVGAMNDVNGDIIAFGGFGVGTGSAKTATDIFTPPNSVSAGVPMPGNLYLTDGAFCPSSGTSHAVGGFGQEQTHYVWDGTAWSVGAATIHTRGGSAIVGVGPYVLSISGGYSTYRNDMEIYDSRAGSWFVYTPGGTNMAQGRRTFANGFHSTRALVDQVNFMAANGWAGTTPVAPLIDGEQIL